VRRIVPGGGELLHPRREVRGLPDGGVVHAEVAPDRPHYDLARVEPHPNLHLNAVRAADVFVVASDRLLHPERRVARPHRVVLVGERRAEERHDAVAHHLVDRALVTVHGLNHPFEHRVEKLARFLGIAVGEQLHRTLQVSEEDRDLLALAFEGRLRGQDLLGEALRGVGFGRRVARLAARSSADGMGAFQAELRRRGQGGAAVRATS